MDRQELRKRYLTAALAAAGIVGGIVFYTLLVEYLTSRGYRAPLQPPAAYIIKYALYIVAAGAYLAVKLVTRALDSRKPDAESTVRLLTTQAVVRAAVSEVPAVCGLLLFLLTGVRADFYMLVLVAIALELYYFPRLPQWEERLRADFGRLPQ